MNSFIRLGATLVALGACQPVPSSAPESTHSAADATEATPEDSLPARRRPLREGVERPGGVHSDPFRQRRDVSGRSIKTPRIRVTHSTTADHPGTSGWLIRHDPMLAYQWGLDLTLREFSAFDGAYGEAGKLAGSTLADGTTPRGSRDHANSCALCHNVPWRTMGAGATIALQSGRGRNTPHLFGAGLIESIGQELRARLLALADANGDGWISPEEGAGQQAVVFDDEGFVDYGRFDDRDGDGRPDLDRMLRVWYVDQDGKRLPWAAHAKHEEVAGYAFEPQVFGAGQRDRFGHGGGASTLRAFTASAFDTHAGIIPCDATLEERGAQDGLAGVSLCGAQQFATTPPRDRGRARDVQGRSLDDPDRDGVLEELTAGDLDLVEWFLLHHPPPAERHHEGRAVFDSLGCASCHRPDWPLEHVRDRRVFTLRLETVDDELRGRLVQTPPGGTLHVRGVYSDFRHHDLGPAFHELQFDGSLQRHFRTTPLWGVGSTAPYGHDGASLTLDAVIRRHGGAAMESAGAYRALNDAQRLALLEFLRSLTLYSVEDLPCDVDGNGTIDEHFLVNGVDTGRERFNPEWCFRTPGHIEGRVRNIDGEWIHSHALLNVDDAYGLNLPYLADRDGDGWPDLRPPLDVR